MNVDVDRLVFQFPDDWQISQYDKWQFYRKQFMTARDGIKAIDLLALSPEHILWLIEVKDYRQHQRTKVIDLTDEMVGKVVDTLAALLPAAVGAINDHERSFARRALACDRLRVVLHLEQPRKTSKLFPRAIDPMDIRQKLRRRLKPIDPHPIVVDRSSTRRLGWTAR
ncbi:MAG: hypothetical protein R3F65_26695 [bacterium]